MALDDFRHYTDWHDRANRRRYGAPADPWRLVPVDPTEVERFTGASLLWGVGRIRGGDWDRPENCRRLRDTEFFEGLRQRFEAGHDWRDTVYVDWAEEKFADRDEFRGCGSLDEFVAEHCAAVDDLYESIRDGGYRPNRGAVYTDPMDAERISDLEPLVLLGRDGDVIWTEGYHRLSVAKLLDVAELPVYVLRRHEEWQRIRDEVAADGVARELERYADHPDLRDVLDTA